MATTLVHEPPAAKAPTSDTVRYVAIRANLLPDEIVSARQLEVVRKQVVLGLVVVVALLIGWFGLSWWQTQLAHNDLDDAQHRTAALQQQQSQFGELVQAQNQVATIHNRLAALMAGDVDWKSMISRLRSAAPSGVLVTAVTASMANVPGTNNGSTQLPVVLNESGKAAVGQISLTGRSQSKSAIAAYADAIGRVKGVVSPLPTAVTSQGGTFTFTITGLLTTDALGGRYSTAAPAAPTGGK